MLPTEELHEKSLFEDNIVKLLSVAQVVCLLHATFCSIVLYFLLQDLEFFTPFLALFSQCLGLFLFMFGIFLL
jgi:hypothetical protein